MSRTYHKQKESNKRGGKAFSSHCANHGSCGYCQGNRHHKFERAAKQFDEDEYSANAYKNDDHDLYMEHNSDIFWSLEYDLDDDNGFSDWETFQLHGGDLKLISYIEDYERMADDILLGDL